MACLGALKQRMLCIRPPRSFFVAAAPASTSAELQSELDRQIDSSLQPVVEWQRKLRRDTCHCQPEVFNPRAVEEDYNSIGSIERSIAERDGKSVSSNKIRSESMQMPPDAIVGSIPDFENTSCKLQESNCTVASTDLFRFIENKLTPMIDKKSAVTHEIESSSQHVCTDENMDYIFISEDRTYTNSIDESLLPKLCYMSRHQYEIYVKSCREWERKIHPGPKESQLYLPSYEEACKKLFSTPVALATSSSMGKNSNEEENLLTTFTFLVSNASLVHSGSARDKSGTKKSKFTRHMNHLKVKFKRKICALLK